MAFVLRLPKPEIPRGNRAKVLTYLEEYCPFFRRFDGYNHRQVDRALWSFGRFL
jgi:hypothetical protein